MRRSHGAVVADDTGELLAVSPFSTPPASPAQPAANCNNSITTQSSLMKLSVIVFTAQNCELQTQDTSLPCAVWGLWGLAMVTSAHRNFRVCLTMHCLDPAFMNTRTTQGTTGCCDSNNFQFSLWLVSRLSCALPNYLREYSLN